MSEDEERVGPDECLVDATDEADESWSPWDGDEYDAELPPVPHVIGTDGLAETAVTEHTVDIPELSKRTLVCMADTSAFVIRDRLRGTILARFTPAEVTRLRDGGWAVTGRQASSRIVEAALSGLHDTTSLRKALARFLDAQWRAWRTRGSYRAVEVEPIRPACEYYIRQATQLPSNPLHKKFVRLCALRRTTEGAMMAVDNLAMWACDARRPRDFESEQLLENFDATKEREGGRRTYHSIFDPAGLDQVQSMAHAEEAERQRARAAVVEQSIFAGTSLGEHEEQNDGGAQG